jgi:hypothetical protein
MLFMAFFLSVLSGFNSECFPGDEHNRVDVRSPVTVKHEEEGGGVSVMAGNQKEKKPGEQASEGSEARES